MRVAIVIGHHMFAKGVFSRWFGKSEFDFFWSMKEDFKKMGFDVYRHNPLIPSYTMRQRVMAKKTRSYDLVIELHFNASNGKAKGCECLYYFNSYEGEKLSQFLCNTYSMLTGCFNRGAKPLYSKDRGYGFVSSQKPTAVLFEPFFGDNDMDCIRFNKDKFLLSLEKTIDYYATIR
jgi:N-acetylmuramoyl-L-alanine amidase